MKKMVIFQFVMYTFTRGYIGVSSNFPLGNDFSPKKNGSVPSSLGLGPVPRCSQNGSVRHGWGAEIHPL